MSTEIFYTKEHHIPAFLIVYPDHGEPYVEFLNKRTGVKDKIPISEFVYELIKKIA